MNVLLLNKPSDFSASWHAAEAHFGYLHECSKPINIIVHKNNVGDLKQNWTNNFEPNKIFLYDSKFKLIKVLYKLRFENFFCLTIKEVFIIHLFTLSMKTKSFFWVQGIAPEEDYLRTKQIWRRVILSFIEIIAFKYAYANIFVSNYMLKYLQKKLSIKSSKNIIVPCTSDLSYDGATKIENSYAYIGGLSAWQKIDVMLQYFNLIASFNSDSKLFLFTQNTDEMQKLVDIHIGSNNIENITIKRLVNRQEIEQQLSKMQYGFLIRDNDPINNVSSPIKLAEYLSCGVNVIISSAVSSYANEIEDAKCGLIVDNTSDLMKLKCVIPSIDNALNYYKSTFDKNNIISKYKNLLDIDNKDMTI